MVLVRKKDGHLHFCVDYRKLNSITHRDAYPLSRIEESLAALNENFSTLDLTKGYWQIQVSEEDKENTAFVLHKFNRIPFRLCNALATFQRVMEHCLRHRNFEIVLLNLDNIIIFSRTEGSSPETRSPIFGPYNELRWGLPRSREDKSDGGVANPTRSERYNPSIE